MFYFCRCFAKFDNKYIALSIFSFILLITTVTSMFTYCTVHIRTLTHHTHCTQSHITDRSVPVLAAEHLFCSQYDKFMLIFLPLCHFHSPSLWRTKSNVLLNDRIGEKTGWEYISAIHNDGVVQCLGAKFVAKKKNCLFPMLFTISFFVERRLSVDAEKTK